MSPIPTPKEGESHDEFIERSHKELAGEYKDDKQRHAISEESWRSHKNSDYSPAENYRPPMTSREDNPDTADYGDGPPVDKGSLRFADFEEEEAPEALFKKWMALSPDERSRLITQYMSSPLSYNPLKDKDVMDSWSHNAGTFFDHPDQIVEYLGEFVRGEHDMYDWTEVMWGDQSLLEDAMDMLEDVMRDDPETQEDIDRAHAEHDLKKIDEPPDMSGWGDPHAQEPGRIDPEGEDPADWWKKMRAKHKLAARTPMKELQIQWRAMKRDLSRKYAGLVESALESWDNLKRVTREVATDPLGSKEPVERESTVWDPDAPRPQELTPEEALAMFPQEVVEEEVAEEKSVLEKQAEVEDAVAEEVQEEVQEEEVEEEEDDRTEEEVSYDDAYKTLREMGFTKTDIKAIERGKDPIEILDDKEKRAAAAEKRKQERQTQRGEKKQKRVKEAVGNININLPAPQEEEIDTSGVEGYDDDPEMKKRIAKHQKTLAKQKEAKGGGEKRPRKSKDFDPYKSAGPETPDISYLDDDDEGAFEKGGKLRDQIPSGDASRYVDEEVGVPENRLRDKLIAKMKKLQCKGTPPPPMPQSFFDEAPERFKNMSVEEQAAEMVLFGVEQYGINPEPTDPPGGEGIRMMDININFGPGDDTMNVEEEPYEEPEDRAGPVETERLVTPTQESEEFEGMFDNWDAIPRETRREILKEHADDEYIKGDPYGDKLTDADKEIYREMYEEDPDLYKPGLEMDDVEDISGITPSRPGQVVPGDPKIVGNKNQKRAIGYDEDTGAWNPDVARESIEDEFGEMDDEEWERTFKELVDIFGPPEGGGGPYDVLKGTGAGMPKNQIPGRTPGGLDDLDPELRREIIRRMAQGATNEDLEREWPGITKKLMRAYKRFGLERFFSYGGHEAARELYDSLMSPEQPLVEPEVDPGIEAVNTYNESLDLDLSPLDLENPGKGWTAPQGGDLEEAQRIDDAWGKWEETDPAWKIQKLMRHLEGPHDRIIPDYTIDHWIDYHQEYLESPDVPEDIDFQRLAEHLYDQGFDFGSIWNDPTEHMPDAEHDPALLASYIEENFSDDDLDNIKEVLGYATDDELIDAILAGDVAPHHVNVDKDTLLDYDSEMQSGNSPGERLQRMMTEEADPPGGYGDPVKVTPRQKAYLEAKTEKEKELIWKSMSDEEQDDLLDKYWD